MDELPAQVLAKLKDLNVGALRYDHYDEEKDSGEFQCRMWRSGCCRS